MEENAAVVRAAQWGLLTASDSRGRLIGAISVSDHGETSLLAKVPLGGEAIPYTAGWATG